MASGLRNTNQSASEVTANILQAAAKPGFSGATIDRKAISDVAALCTATSRLEPSGELSQTAMRELATSETLAIAWAMTFSLQYATMQNSKETGPKEDNVGEIPESAAFDTTSIVLS